MRSPVNHRRRSLQLVLALAAIVASLAIAACGSSSGTTSTSTSATSSGGSTAARTALVQCLKQHGITPPAHAPGSGTGTRPAGTAPAGSTGAGGAGSSARQAAFKACGATGHLGGSATGSTAS
jgi:hypothetical protein